MEMVCRGAAQPHWPMGSAGQEEAQGSCSKASVPGKTRDSQLKSLMEHQKELGMAKALLQARVDQLERKVQAAIGNSFDRDAREARLSVAEEMSREAWVDLEDNVKPGLAAMQKQADALQLRLATLEHQQQQPAQGLPGRDGDVDGVGSLQVADAAAEAVAAQVQLLSAAVEEAAGQAGSLHKGVLDLVQPALEELTSSSASAGNLLQALQLQQAALQGQAAAEQHAAVLQQVEGLASAAQLADLQQQVAELEEQVAELRQAPSLSSDVEAVVAVQGKLQVQVQELQRTVEEAEVRLLSTAVKAASTDQAAQQLQLAKLQDTVGGVAQSQDELCRMLEQVQSAVQAGSSAHKGLQHELQQLQDLVAAVAGTDPAALPPRVQQLEMAVEGISNGQPGVSDQLLSLQGALQSSLQEHAAMQQQLSKLEAVLQSRWRFRGRQPLSASLTL
ncbi:hypothetical protein HaLaN_05204 [Haematococcus lacustris]|uniref:Uncharacterized protein n=1 Tax=Haematococcus lacustris TaxID=44745 RepID=A0A699YU75_HAELA|nr:hypothetical protein HaLaN_05204 [Haematococcus lacustris]